MNNSDNSNFNQENMPFVAPCKHLTPFASIGWLRLGYKDLRRAPTASLLYGFVMALVIATTCTMAFLYGSYWFMFAMLGGFVFLAPLTCIGLYAISAQLERGQPPSLGRSLRASFKRHIGNEMVFALALLVLFLVWARAGAMVSVFFPTVGNPSWRELIVYLSVGSLVGALFAIVTFALSAFSLPMIVHRNVDSITAIVTSINAFLRNKLAMLIWLAIIIMGLLIGAATAFVGLIVILPWIGYAAWHGYQETIDTSGFPRHEDGITSEPKLRNNKD